jgi:hypothetical protein
MHVHSLFGPLVHSYVSFISLFSSLDRSARRIIGRRPKFTEWDDGLLKSYLDPSGQRSKVSSQHTHDQICLAWPGSRVPLNASGKEMPVGSIMAVDWPYWRTGCLTDLAPKGFDVSSVRFDLGSDLSVVDPDEEARIKDARKDLLAAFRQVCLVALFCVNNRLSDFLSEHWKPPSVSQSKRSWNVPNGRC